MKLRTSILVPVVSILLLVGGAGIAYIAVSQRADALAHEKAALESSATRDARRIESVIEQRLTFVEIVASTKATTDIEVAIAGSDLKNLLINQNLHRLLASGTTDVLTSIAVIDAAGIEVVAAQGGRIVPVVRPHDHSGSAEYAFARGSADEGGTTAALREPAVLVEPDAAELLLIAPVLDPKGGFRGLVRATLPLDSLVGSFASESSVPALAFAPSTHAAHGPEGAGTLSTVATVLEARTLDGSVARLQVERTVATSSVTGALDQTALTTAGLLCLILLLLVGTLAWIVRVRVAPADELATAVRRIGKGDYATRVEPQGAQEFVDLARGVNAMVADLAMRERAVLEQSAQQAQLDKLATLGSLSSGIAHEINNPLSFMDLETQMFLADLEGSPPDELPEGWKEAAMRFASTNKEGIDRVAKIVRSLRLLAKPNSERRRVDLADLVDATATLAHASLKGRELRVEIPRDVRVHAVGDHVGQIVLNLLINAADAVPTPGGRIRVRAWTKEDRTFLAVEDNGPGIPEAIKPQIFTPFFTTKAKGTGLGLGISRRLADEDGGSLRFEDRPGGGTIFTLELPADGKAPCPAAASALAPVRPVPTGA